MATRLNRAADQSVLLATSQYPGSRISEVSVENT